MIDKELYSPADVSQALGVSVTTIKRWVDAGVLPAHKTAGGHRKILRGDVLNIVRERRLPSVDLSRLKIHSRAEELDTIKLSHELFDALRAGDVNLTRSVIHGAYAAGMAMAEIGDNVVARAMSRLGHDWEMGHLDVMHEHRATLLCTSVLHELKPTVEAIAELGRPIAAGGSPEGDPSLLASLLVQLVLIEAGWDAVNLGPHTPMASFRLALCELKPLLLWLSASHVPDSKKFLIEYAELYTHAERAGVAVAVGGRALGVSLRAVMPYTFHGECLTDLAAFARTLHPRPRPPKRGRPPKESR